MKTKIESKWILLQRRSEAILNGLAILLSTFHILILFGAYAFKTFSDTTLLIDKWLIGLILLIYGVCAFLRKGNENKIKAKDRKNESRFFGLHMALLIFLFVWYIISCIYMTSEQKWDFLGANTPYILDSMISIFVLYPLAHLLRKTPQYIWWMLHLIMTVATVFMGYVLINLFRLNIPTLPGGQIGMDDSASLIIACNRNTTGAFGALLFMLSVLMIIKCRNIYVKGCYGVAAVIHLLVMNLSNSRTACYAVLVSCAFLATMMCIQRCNKVALPQRILAGIGCGIIAGAFIYISRKLSYDLFEGITHFSELLGKSTTAGDQIRNDLTYLSGREGIFASFLPAMFQSIQRFIFGVTPAGVENQITSVGIVSGDGMTYMHNQYMQMGVAFGFPGLAAYTVWTVLLARKCIKNLKTPEGIALASVILMLIISNMFESYLFAFAYFCGSMFFLISGIMMTDLMQEKTDLVNTETVEKPQMDKLKKVATSIKVFSGLSWMKKVTILYLVSVLVYSVIAFVLRDGPIVIIDESLYTNIARSLAWDGTIAYRAQPVDYPYILYPLLLVPVYRLQNLIGGDIYRWVQAFNALLICSSVFPVYLFGKEFTGKENKGFLAAVFTVIIADMLMSSLEMTESLVWPLSLWMMYFAWKMVSGEKTCYGILTGLFAGLLFFTKPGSIAMGIIILLVYLFGCLKNKKSPKAALLGLLTLLGMVVLVYCQYVVVFGNEFTLLGLYKKQTSDWVASHYWGALLGFVEMIVAFCMAGAGLFVLLPYFAMDAYDSKQKTMILLSTLGLMVVSLGVAIFVSPFKWSGLAAELPVHLRYVSMFFPVWIVYTLSVSESRKPGKGFAPTMVAFMVLALLMGMTKACLSQSSDNTVDSALLAVFTQNSRLNGTISGIIFILLLTAAVVTLLVQLRKNKSIQVSKAVCLAFGGLLLFNSLCAGVSLSIPIDEGQKEDAIELNEMIKDEPSVLGVTQKYYNDIYTYWQEAHLNKPMQEVTIEQLALSTWDTGGVYQPFVPIEQSPNLNNGYTPENPVMVLGQTIANHLELSASTSTKTTKNQYYTVVYLEPNERWLDSMMFGMEDNHLGVGETATVVMFNKERNVEWMVLKLSAPKDDTTLEFMQNDQKSSITIAAGESIEINVPVHATIIDITADKGIFLNGYTLK